MRYAWLAALALLAVALGAAVADSGYEAVNGTLTVEGGTEGGIRLAPSSDGPASVDLGTLTPPGAWRCTVEFGYGVTRAGLRLVSSGAVVAECSLSPAAGGAFRALVPGERSPWPDEGCGVVPYQPYTIEVVAEKSRFRAQLLTAGTSEVLSQSPWIVLRDTPPELSVNALTRGGIARFREWTHAEKPLAELMEFPPNARRLTAAGAPWKIVGGGRWEWTDPARSAIRQLATVERTTAVWTEKRSGPGVTARCRVRVTPGAGGAGLLVQASEKVDSGYLIWLGGEFGNGCLMLYSLPLTPLWSGPTGMWKYDTDYVLEITTEPARLRGRMLASDGQTVLIESPWVDVPEANRCGEGYQAFMTWLGKAEFGGLAGDVAAVPGPTVPARVLGDGWRELSGTWRWATADRRALGGLAAEDPARAIAPGLEGTMSRWSLTVRLGDASEAGMLFQAAPDGSDGFLALIDSAGRVTLREVTQPERILWETKVAVAAGALCTLEGEKATDQVFLRVRGADGVVLADSGRIFISGRHNERVGGLGLVVAKGSAAFARWRVEATK